MQEHDLFESEMLALERARVALMEGESSPELWREALDTLSRDFERLVREMRRLIRHSDRTERELNLANARLTDLAAALEYSNQHDGLTGLLNRATFIDRARRHIDRQSVALILIDIDHFKRINDQHGHPVGDAVLIDVARRLRQAAGDEVETGRMGGEEFGLLVHGGDVRERARQIAESCRATLEARAPEVLPETPVTASFGVCQAGQGEGFELLYVRTDEALYRAKHEGRNRVLCCPNVCC
ncbi:MAG: GGDEF domain-containing protein [Halothiobacillaceae bacterium]|jgi:diguanylate cyclase (GGDEF)-like protein|nr:GGDEF domain-containing protein [Halothiobacillaceae bacterium]